MTIPAITGPTRVPQRPTPATAPVKAQVTAQPSLASYTAAKARWQAFADAEKGLPLQKGSQTRLYLHDTPAPRGTLVMYHGYTAGTWQFEPLAKQAFADGYDVVIPRLPGHGFKTADGVEDPSHLLNASNWKQYGGFADQTYAMAKALGGPVSVLGLSVGGDIALDVAERYKVAKVVAYAPFLEPAGVGGKIADFVHVLDKLCFGLAGRGLALVGWGWGKECEALTASGQRPGHSKFSLGTLYGAAEYGKQVTAHAAQIQAETEFFTTGADDAADEGAIRRTYDAAGGAATGGWYHYPKAEGIPHPMVHPMEDKGKGQTPALYQLTLNFLERGQRANRNEGE